MDSITSEVRTALRSVERKYGVTFTTGRPRGGRMVLKIARDPARRLAGNRQFFDQHAAEVGLHPKHYGREFVVDGREYVLVGVNPRARQFAAIASNQGKLYRLDVAAVREAIDAG